MTEFSDDYDPLKDETLPEMTRQVYAARLETYEQARRGLRETVNKIKAHRLAQLQEMPKCPECGAGIIRPKCALELGAGCPRHDMVEDYGGDTAIQKHFRIGYYRDG